MENEIIYKNTKLSYGRYLFNKCLPYDYPVINKQIDKKELLNILNDIVLKYSKDECMEVLDKIKELGFIESTNAGYTLSIEDLYFPEFKNFIEKLDDKNIAYNINKLNNNKILNKIKSNKFFNFIQSGSRGSLDQLLQLVCCRGYIADSDNNIRPNMIRHSLVSGLNKDEFFDSSYGCRKGLLDTALSTSASGYFNRQLVYASVMTTIDLDCEDCGTTDYLHVHVCIKKSDGTMDEEKTKKFAETFIWRYIAVGNDNKLILLTKNNYQYIIGKHIKVRSPIFCKNKKICKKCYGTLSKILHSEAIGIIASQSLSERMTQLVLRTFHISGVVSTLNENTETNKDVISGLSVINKLFHKTESTGCKTPEDFVQRLFNIFVDYGNLLSIHYEVLIASMMWSMDEETVWRLLENRNNHPYKFVSILKIPSISSWLLGVAFSRLQNKLLDGLINEKEDSVNALSQLFQY